MITIEEIYLHMVRLMENENMSKEQAQQEALESEGISSDDWTDDHQKALDDRFERHEEAKRRELEEEQTLERDESTDEFNPNMEG